MNTLLGPMTENDWPSVAEIYKEGIETSNATLEKDIPTREKWNAEHLPGKIIGF